MRRQRKLLFLFLLMTYWPVGTEARCDTAVQRQTFHRSRWWPLSGPGHMIQSYVTTCSGVTTLLLFSPCSSHKSLWWDLTHAFFPRVFRPSLFSTKGLSRTATWLYLVFSCASIFSEILMEIYQILNPKWHINVCIYVLKCCVLLHT